METIKDIPAQLRHPIKTKLIQVNLPKTKDLRFYFQKGTVCFGPEQFVVELSKGRYWMALNGPEAFYEEEALWTDEELLQAKEEEKTVLAVMLDYRWTDDNPYVVCTFHVEIYNCNANNRELVQQLMQNLNNRQFSLTDEAINHVFSTWEELKLELAEVKAMKSDLFKESKSYITRLTQRVGDIMENSQPITEETFIAASEKQKYMSTMLRGKINDVYRNPYHEGSRLARMATILADTMIDRLVDSVYQKGIQQSNKELIRAISTVESLMPPEMQYKVPDEFIKLKKEQLALAYEIEVYKREQKEIRRRQLEAEREERRAQKELEREIKKAQQDELDAQAAIERNRFEMAKAKTEDQVQKFKEKIALLEEALRHAQERHERALSMAQQTKCGYVYIISNIGSFGDNVYKIGMTRRVEPMERIAELSSASVPFPFDVHAMIYTDDAPGLEAELHRSFDKKKVNAVNWRKEYFNVSLEEIRERIKDLGIECEWVENPSAGQYRDSIRITENNR